MFRLCICLFWHGATVYHITNSHRDLMLNISHRDRLDCRISYLLLYINNPTSQSIGQPCSRRHLP